MKGWEWPTPDEACAAYSRGLLVRTLHESETSLRAKGKLDLASHYQDLALAVENGQVKSHHGWEVVALYLQLHSGFPETEEQ